jgi:DNA-binding transcriptional ArsR family regulator
VTHPPTTQDEALRTLRFACSCASGAPAAADPWVAIAKQGKLADGTKERILNAVHREPRSITELSRLLGLSPPAVHRHVAELLASELVREVPIPSGERGSPTERRYRPAFPVVLAEDRRDLDPAIEELALAIAGAFRSRRDDLAIALLRTGLPGRADAGEVLLHYLFATATRLAREELEAAGDLPPWPEHGDGSRWVWWAEEPPETEVASTRRTIHDDSDARDWGDPPRRLVIMEEPR